MTEQQNDAQMPGEECHCGDITYQFMGQKQTDRVLVLVHGLASNATRWSEFMSLSNLKESNALLAVDLRGHGRSMVFNNYTRSDWCRDISELVDRRSALLVGHSMGAQVALEYALRYPCRGLVLIDPVFPDALSGVLKWVAHTRYFFWIVIRLLRLLQKFGLRKKHYVYRDLYALDRQTRDFLLNNPDKDIADLYMDPFEDLPYLPLSNYLQDLFEVTRPLGNIAAITCPVLVLLSKGASTSNVERNQLELAKLQDCETLLVDADHWLLTEQPQAARAAIEDWYQRKFAVA